DDIDLVFADAAGIPELDQREAGAIRAVFGPGAVPVTAPKTMTGRLLAGGSALDLASALLAIRDGVIPPTTGITDLVPGCDLDLVTSARQADIGAVLIQARGYGGFNTALVVTSCGDKE